MFILGKIKPNWRKTAKHYLATVPVLMIGSKVSAIYKASLSSLTTRVLNPVVKSKIIEPVLTVLTTSHCVCTSCGQTGKIGQPAFLNLTNINIHQKALQNINWVCCLFTGVWWLVSFVQTWKKTTILQNQDRYKINFT